MLGGRAPGAPLPLDPPLVLYIYALSVYNDLLANAWSKFNALVDTNAFWDIHKQICHHWQKQMNTEQPRNGNINVIKHSNTEDLRVSEITNRPFAHFRIWF